MKSSITVSVALALFKLRWSCVGGFDPNVMSHNMGLYFEHFFWGIKDTYIGTKRSMSYGWYIAETSLKDKDVVWQTKAAEYFYYHEYKGRNRRYRRWTRRMRRADEVSNEVKNTRVSWFHPVERMKKHRRKSRAHKNTNETARRFEWARQRLFYEFYCTPTMYSKRAALCQWALLNQALEPRRLVMDYATVPACEQRRVNLEYRHFQTEGTVLRCTYLVQNVDYETSGTKFTAYIKAVKNPAEYRLILYWLEEAAPSQGMLPQDIGATTSGNPSGASQNFVPAQRGVAATDGHLNVGQNYIPYPNATAAANASGQSYPYGTVPAQPHTNAQKHNQVRTHQAADQKAHLYAQQYPQWTVPSQPHTDAQKYSQPQIPVPQTTNPYVFLDPVTKAGSSNNVGPAKTAATNAQMASDYGMVSVDLNPPPLRVVYLLLNRRFSRNPADKLV